MKTILQEQRRSSVIVALITMVLGAVLVVWPDRSVRLMCTLLGAALLLHGADGYQQRKAAVQTA